MSHNPTQPPQKLSIDQKGGKERIEKAVVEELGFVMELSQMGSPRKMEHVFPRH